MTICLLQAAERLLQADDLAIGTVVRIDRRIGSLEGEPYFRIVVAVRPSRPVCWKVE